MWLVAERQGFEPWVPVRVQRFSRPPRSTTPASFLGFCAAKVRRLFGLSKFFDGFFSTQAQFLIFVGGELVGDSGGMSFLTVYYAAALESDGCGYPLHGMIVGVGVESDGI